MKSIRLFLILIVALSSSTLWADRPVSGCEVFLLGSHEARPYNRVVDFMLKRFVPVRYQIESRGLSDIQQNNRGILFLSNHEAPIDPVVVLSQLRHFQARPVMAEELVSSPVIGPILKKMAGGVNAILVPAKSKWKKDFGAKIQIVLEEVSRVLQRGDNILLYPAGTVQRSARESIVGKRAVETILRSNPNVRIVLIRQRGLWGSSFSWGGSDNNDIEKTNTGTLLGRGIWNSFWSLLSNGIVLTPKRPVTLEFLEPLDFPRNGSREEINKYLENFFNDESHPEKRVHVPYHFLLGREPVELESVDYTRPQKLSGARLETTELMVSD